MINWEEVVSKFGLSPENQKEWLDAMQDNPIVLKAQWEVSYWKSGSGFSHSETVANTEEHEVLTPDEMKQSLKDWWYEDGWTDDEYDGHYWKVNYYTKDGSHLDEEVCWMYPEDFE